jgi:fibronectin type 3 domain-containing protein
VTGTGVASTNVIQLSWTASTSASVVGYNVYRSSVSGGPYTKIVSSPVIGTSYSDQTAQAGVQYYYVATSVGENGIESTYSNQVTALIP